MPLSHLEGIYGYDNVNRCCHSFSACVLMVPAITSLELSCAFFRKHRASPFALTKGIFLGVDPHRLPVTRNRSFFQCTFMLGQGADADTC